MSKHINSHHRSKSFWQTREIFSIRTFKVGTVSVAIAVSLLGANVTQNRVQAETLTPAPETTTSLSLPQDSGQATTEASVLQEPQSETKTNDSDYLTSPVVEQTNSPEIKEGAQIVTQQNPERPQEYQPDLAQVAKTDQSPTKNQPNDQEMLKPLMQQDIVSPQKPNTPPVQEGYLRLHLQGLDQSKEAAYSLWKWGGVDQASDGANWPNDAQAFKAEDQDDFGRYIDIKKSQTPASIGYLLLKDGQKISPDDQKIDLPLPGINEVWVTTDGKVYYYKPLADDKLLRIHYKRDDKTYDGWGAWLWGDVEKASEDWPKGALDLTKVGPYGRYVDVPLTKALNSKLGFLLVNKSNPELPGHKLGDLAFNGRKIHSQIFLKNDDTTVYTNPFYLPEQAEVDTANTQPGQANVSISGRVLAPFNYNQSGLLEISLKNPEQAKILKMEVNTSAIGGGTLPISPELNRVAIKASSSTLPGTYELLVRAYDDKNGYYEGKIPVTISQRQKTTGEKDWDEQIIYFMVTDRFYNADKTNDNPYHQAYDKAKNPRGTYQGGDFKGVTAKLDYLKSLGVSAIWITPIVENIPQNVGSEKDGDYYAYHGYWASNFEKLNPHLGSLKDFHDLIDEAAKRNINIIVDVVLNHAGYGSEKTFAGLIRSPEENQEGDDQKGSLAGLPDFKTEDKKVRDQLVAWQSSWLNRSTTAKGNSIYAFRVDTVKHVDDTTWQHFKNELVAKNSGFHLIGETWGANYKDTKGDLNSGTMDSLLDFGFKDIAKLFVNGQIQAASQELENRDKSLTSLATLGQFLSSHDEDGFLYSLGGDLAKFKVASSLLLTAKGQPIIYYGEEIGQTGANNWPIYDNRYNFDWSKTQKNDLLTHYQKLLSFRNSYSNLLSKGQYETLALNQEQGWLLTKRSHEQTALYLLYTQAETRSNLSLTVSENTKLLDHYTGKTYQAQKNAQGQWTIQLTTPTRQEGGIMLLTVESGQILSHKTDQEPIAKNHLRLHFKTLPADNPSSLGLWVWEDVAKPSTNWPSGALNLDKIKKDAYGYYLDVELANNKQEKIGLLINNAAGQNLTGDKFVPLISPQMNQVWFDEAYNSYTYPPQAKGTLRINYFRKDGNYQGKALWLWGDLLKKEGQLTEWPNGLDFEQQGAYGVYRDIPLTQLPQSLGFLLLDKTKTGDDVKIQPKDYQFTDFKNHSQIFLKDDDEAIYTNPYFVNTITATGAQQTSLNTIETSFTSLEGLTQEQLRQKLSVSNSSGHTLPITEVELNPQLKTAILKGDFPMSDKPYQVTFGDDKFTAQANWQLKDQLYAYDGPLGARVQQNGRLVDLTLWSPSADHVALVIYDKTDQDKVIAQLPMAKGDKGTWTIQLTPDKQLGISDYRGYYYHYKISRGNDSVLALDPYAKSLAAWNSDLAETDPARKIAKAAILDPSQIGPQDLNFAKIPGFKQREDAIIYEAHVRDFTSDKGIESTLKAPFGTFSAFIEKLDYLKDLGVTHIQLLPIMSYYFVNEMNRERSDHYSSSGNNYNWGYDPQSYFALTGMYSTDPSQADKRIAEFKTLVQEIHKRGMGVILDVVYNHTAKDFIFEDLEPNYYHFMDADGTSRTSFGGGRLGTTHYMSRRILVDSISYLVNEFKVDGFRFDMMGDHDAESILAAYQAARKLNPNLIMLGEGWKTYVGDENQPQQPADQTWMAQTDTVAVFSDDIRNSLKSGYPNEGQPAFITGGRQNIQKLFNNIKAQPNNFTADSPGDVIQYIAAHDNLTLFDIIAQSIKKDPAFPENLQEIHQRQRLGNLLVLTAQGTPFLHAGQEYGRTKQFLDDNYKEPVSEDKVPNKAHLLSNPDGSPFIYPYFIHDSYDATDAINRFDWQKATDEKAYPLHHITQAYTKGLIQLRRSTDAFSLKTKTDIEQKVSLISQPDGKTIEQEDLVIAYQTIASNGDIYAVFINADKKERSFTLGQAFAHLTQAKIIADARQVRLDGIDTPEGVAFSDNTLTLTPLTATILHLSKEKPLPERHEEKVKTNKSNQQEEIANTDVKAEQAEKLFIQEKISKNKQPLVRHVRTSHSDSKPKHLSAGPSNQGKLLPQTGEKSRKLFPLVGSTILIALASLIPSKKWLNNKKS